MIAFGDFVRLTNVLQTAGTSLPPKYQVKPSHSGGKQVAVLLGTELWNEVTDRLKPSVEHEDILEVLKNDSVESLLGVTYGRRSSHNNQTAARLISR